VTLPGGQKVFIITTPFFLGTKMEAFKGRGPHVIALRAALEEMHGQDSRSCRQQAGTDLTLRCRDSTWKPIADCPANAVCVDTRKPSVSVPTRRCGDVALPAVPYEPCEMITKRVSSLSLVRYRTNDYEAQI
jgi:hypothetical protein